MENLPSPSWWTPIAGVKRYILQVLLFPQQCPETYSGVRLEGTFVSQFLAAQPDCHVPLRRDTIHKHCSNTGRTTPVSIL